MKIEAPSPNLLAQEVTKVRKAAKAAQVEQPQQTTVQLTDQVKVLSRKAMVADVGELQAAQDAKIQAVKARVAEGNYQVSGRDLAEKMLARSTKS
ncbi:flagellar biosynthesis anti-sigma factor FlgM [Geomonas sp. RF6]|uniref:flagellar biosynthesis anti-sigma factor FlgM n=1 Tax=Geomonas sp. RF6 TaxID=2897342 RepID=UPI001E62C36F|nr:flagellar biosynthesis anti-sigma factor FlgM [Geomonas sp. RF6]UFS72154.1 flagellar biosynthesis anti-sigma factor FlgM [Geomonas sp. RF6]